jgi:PAS domain S-box-containing protein
VQANVAFRARGRPAFSLLRARGTTTRAVVISPRVGAPHVRGILFHSIGVPVGMMACVAGAVAYLGDRLPAAAPFLVPILCAAALGAAVRSQEQLHALVKEREEALRACEQQVRAVLDAAHDGLLVVDDAGTVLDANAAASALVGRERTWLVGARFGELCADPGPATARFVRALRAPSVPTELRLVHSDGTARDAELTVARDVVPGRHLFVLRDLCERKRYEEEIRRLHSTLELRVRERTASLEALNRELESFSYSVSHDLRSPLRHINGYSDLLRKSATGGLDASAVRYLDTIVDAAHRASTLVDELLAFARMGQAEMRNTEIEMSALVHEVRREVERDAEGRDVRWYVGPLPRIRGDAAMLKLAVRNLLSNALKYSRPRAKAEIRIEAERVRDEFIFRVRDNGVGFDMAAAGSLFGVFKRLHSEAEFEGTGIGLANVRRIIERHGGRAWAESRLGEGATFSFSIPDRRAASGVEP